MVDYYLFARMPRQSDWHSKEHTRPGSHFPWQGLCSPLESQPGLHRALIIILGVTRPVFCGFPSFTRC